MRGLVVVGRPCCLIVLGPKKCSRPEPSTQGAHYLRSTLGGGGGGAGGGLVSKLARMYYSQCTGE